MLRGLYLCRKPLVIKGLRKSDFRKSLIVNHLWLFSLRWVLCLHLSKNCRTLYYMRKTTQRIKDAFDNGQSLTVNNTRTDGTSVYLFGNEIVRRDANGKVYATLAGWNTVTTRERVNGITGLNFHQVNHEPLLDGKSVDSSEWIAVQWLSLLLWELLF